MPFKNKSFKCQSVLEDEYEPECEDDILFSAFYSFSYSGVGPIMPLTP
jgi:hypothetical protein